MSVLLTEPTQQANDKVFKTAHVAFSVVTGTGRYVTGLKQFRDANPRVGSLAAAACHGLELPL
ncbi:hypothetical protein [Escherichia coli]|uniref:hypothetical protein n=1 Tax=Escherichia coli TaxID=562 RepID=UPI0007A6132B|nr:hypothetical protein [Escherichia coli]